MPHVIADPLIDCEEPDCDRKGENGFCCNMHMKRHLTSAHGAGQEMVECEYGCGESFKRSGYKAHLMRAHGIVFSKDTGEPIVSTTSDSPTELGPDEQATEVIPIELIVKEIKRLYVAEKSYERTVQRLKDELDIKTHEASEAKKEAKHFRRLFEGNEAQNAELKGKAMELVRQVKSLQRGGGLKVSVAEQLGMTSDDIARLMREMPGAPAHVNNGSKG